MKIELPEYVMDCIRLLKQNGFEAYCVGGAVRDLLLGIEPFDYDITTSAPPQVVMKLFPRNIPTGLKHGTVTVVTSDGNIEVTTFRSEEGFSDSRHPDIVTFIGNIKDDLERRDFTVNAIGYDGESFVSVENSFSDLENKIIRAVGDPEKRFCEDALRILRCFRFAAQLGSKIEEKTLCAALKYPRALDFVSAERIAEELKKLLISDGVVLANPLFQSPLLEFMEIGAGELPDWFKDLPKSPRIRIAAALYILGCDPLAVCMNLKFSNRLTDDVFLAYSVLERPFNKTRPTLKRMLGNIEADFIKELLAAREVFFDEKHENTICELEDILKSGEAYTLKALAVSGSDLISQGYSGAEVGKELKKLLDLVIDNPSLNTKNILLEISAKDK